MAEIELKPPVLVSQLTTDYTTITPTLTKTIIFNLWFSNFFNAENIQFFVLFTTLYSLSYMALYFL